MTRSLCNEPKTKIVLQRITERVQTMPTLLGCVVKIRYLEHDVANEERFPKFSQHIYLESIGRGPFGGPILQPKSWVAGLENTRILNLLEIPNFGRGKEVNNCIKKLKEVLHGGFLYMEQPTSIDVELIATIMGFSSMGKNLAQYLDEKTKEKELAEEMNREYGTKRGSCNIIIKSISDVTTQMATKIMAYKML
jgi:hypothetical protein